jgi:shikimate kinase
MSRQTPWPAVAVGRIVLTGFMGAGKSTVGSLLAARLGWRFLDSDSVVEARAGMTVAEIFARAGEPAFREMEAFAIRESAVVDATVLALGGGALETAGTREFLASLPDCALIFLEAPLETLIRRCSGDAEAPVRPVLADRARLAERYDARLAWYRQAHLTVSTAGISPEQVAERIAQWVAAGSEQPKRGVPA